MTSYSMQLEHTQEPSSSHKISVRNYYIVLQAVHFANSTMQWRF